MDNNIWNLKQSEKICALDIDGVLNTYPEEWIMFVNNKTDNVFTDLNQVKRSLPYDTYRNLKEDYRLSGVKEHLKVRPFASEMTKHLKAMGYKIIIITARPINKYPQLYQQTLNWLNKNEIKFDLLYFGERNKHVKILNEVPNLRFMIEDNSYVANMVAKWGYKVFLVSNQYNYNLELMPSVIRIEELEEVIHHVRKF